MQISSYFYHTLARCMNLFFPNQFQGKSINGQILVKNWKKYYTPKCNENVKSDSLIGVFC